MSALHSYCTSQICRESTADSSFAVAKDPRGNTLGRGTEITMFLKEDSVEFLKQDKLEELVQKYSEFITFPIKLYKKTTKIVDVEEDSEVEEESDTDTDGEFSKGDDLEVEEEEEEEYDKNTAEKKTETVSLLFLLFCNP